MHRNQVLFGTLLLLLALTLIFALAANAMPRQAHAQGTYPEGVTGVLMVEWQRFIILEPGYTAAQVGSCVSLPETAPLPNTDNTGNGGIGE